MNKGTCALIITCLLPLNSASAQSSSPFVVTDTGRRPAIAVDDSGRAAIVWADTSSNAIYYRCFDSLGGTLTDTLSLSMPPTLLGVQQPAVALSGHAAMVVWRLVSFTFNSYIFGRGVAFPGGALGGQDQINDTHFDANRFSPRAAGLNDSTFLIVWGGNGPQTPYRSGIYAQRISSTGDRLGLNMLLSDDTAQAFDNRVPRIAHAAGGGTLLVAWLNETSQGKRVVARYFTESLTPLGPSWPVADDTSFSEYWSPATGMDPHGNVSIAWGAEQRNGLWNVYCARYDREGNLITPAVSIDDGGDFDWTPEVRMAIDENGNMVLIWETVAKGTYRLKGQRFDPHGNRVGVNFFVCDSPDTLKQLYPEVEMREGKIYVVWQQEHRRVFARFFNYYDPSLGVYDGLSLHTEGFQLFQNYPNPFNPATTIPLHLATRERVTLTVYDVLGQEVQQIFAGHLGPGYHAFRWDTRASRWPVATGVYFCRLSTGRSTQAIKLLVLQ